MKKLITTEDLTAYLQRLTWGVDHHASNLKAVWATVLVHLLLAVDGKPLAVATRNGALTPASWAVIGTQRFAFTSRKISKHHYEIVVRKGTMRGPEFTRFTDAMSADAIAEQFSAMKAAA